MKELTPMQELIETLTNLIELSSIENIILNSVKNRAIELLPKEQQVIEDFKSQKEMYKECFEIFIPKDKWDEATLFLSTYVSGVAKDMAEKEKKLK